MICQVSFYPPEGVGDQKYDESAASMTAMLRYGSGFPWNRLESLENIRPATGTSK